MGDAVIQIVNAFSSGGKTPVMWLNEICVKLRAQLIWVERDLKKSKTDLPSFDYTANVVKYDEKDENNINVSCCGAPATTKKEAKHNAAAAMLQKLGITRKDLEIKKSSSRSPPPAPAQVSTIQPTLEGGEASIQAQEAVNETEEKKETGPAPLSNNNNRISSWDIDVAKISPSSAVELASFCVKRKLPAPTFSDAKEEGPDNRKKFFVDCRVQTGEKEIHVTGDASQKRKAKNIAAAIMLDKLKSEPIAPERAVTVQTIAAVQQLPLSPGPGKLVCDNFRYCHKQISHDHHKFLNLGGPTLMSLGGKNLKDTNCKKLLETIAEEEKFDVTYKRVKETAGDPQSYCQLSYRRDKGPLGGPPSVFVGEGPTNDAALQNSAREALAFLLVVSGKHN